MAAKRWEHFPHEADIGLRGVGPTPADAFEQAALALTGVVVDPGKAEGRIPVAVVCEAAEDDLLLLDWINALIYEMATRKMLFGRFEVAVSGGRLRATAWGEPVDVKRHQPAVEPKGATFTALKVAREGGEWVAQCVVDV